MLGPIWLTTALIMFGVMFIATRLRFFDSLIRGGKTWEKGSTEAKTRALGLTILYIIVIMGTALGVEAFVEEIQNAV